MQASRQKLKHRRPGNALPQSRPLQYQLSQYPGSVAVSATLKKSSNLALAMRDDDSESRKFFLLGLLCFSTVHEGHRGSRFFLVEEVNFLREAVWVCGAYHCAEERALEAQNKNSSSRTAASMYQRGLSASVSAEKAAETDHCGTRF